MKRAGIFFFYDRDGIVDEYITYLLSKIRPYISTLLFVCNGKLNPDSRIEIEKITPNILMRQNEGFDVWAYKEGMDFLGWNKLKSFDEIIMFNFTIYGPIFPFDEMFNKMDKMSIDFWGITKYHRMDFDPTGIISYKYMPEHIQSHFIAVRKEMFSSPEYYHYWTNMKPIRNYNSAVGFHEAIFTKHFSDFGFKWKVYIDTDDLQEETNYPLMFLPLEMVKYRRCPIIKRKLFFLRYDLQLNEGSGSAPSDVIKYLREETDYKVHMIYQNLVRDQEMTVLRQNLQLRYGIPDCELKESTQLFFKKAVYIYLGQDYYATKILQHLIDYSDFSTNVFIAFSEDFSFNAVEAQINRLSQLKKVIILPSGNSISCFLDFLCEDANNYDFVCFIQSITRDFEYKNYLSSTAEKHNFYLKSLLKNPTYVNNIIKIFNDYPFLGVLASEPLTFSASAFSYADNWRLNASKILRIAELIKLTLPIRLISEPSITTEQMFWFRPRALMYLKKWYLENKDNPKIMDDFLRDREGFFKLLSFIAQEMGFYTGFIYALDDSNLIQTNMDYLLKYHNLSKYKIKQWAISHLPGIANLLIPIYRKIRSLLNST